MNVDEFDFDLPGELIAQTPMTPRDAARLLCIGETLDDRIVSDLPDRLRPGDLLVVNDTCVLPSRVTALSGEREFSLTFIKKFDECRWYAFAKPGKRLKVGMCVEIGGSCRVEVEEKLDDGRVLFRFDREGDAILALFDDVGGMPLPPYIRRGSGSDARDHDDYQTIFAAKKGAVAAPTAGLHFTPDLLSKLAERGIERATLTLHVGAGTFLPVKVDNTEHHRMHKEWLSIDEENAAKINQARSENRRIVAVGTTSLRALEASVGEDGQVQGGARETDLFITPGYRFRAVDCLLTNFHLPKSTLFMLVSAFAGLERMHAAYAHAIQERYRFFSYGDATLIERGCD